MLVYLLRHAIAESRAASDQLRELTGQGVQQNEAVIRQFERHSPQLDRTLVSPYRRAQQTAAGLVSTLPGIKCEVCNELTPDSDVYDLVKIIEKAAVKQLMLVGHNPILSNLLSLLIDGTLGSNHHLGNSTLVCVEMNIAAAGCGEIQYTLQP